MLKRLLRNSVANDSERRNAEVNGTVITVKSSAAGITAGAC